MKKSPVYAELSRLGALTDGVYAIVLTLLVLDLKPPSAAMLTDRELLADLSMKTHSFVAYIISFIVCTILWLRHHRLFRLIPRGRPIVFGLNMLHMLFVTLLPFGSMLVGQYMHDMTAVIIFSVCLGGASLTLSQIQSFAMRHPDCLAQGVTIDLVAETWWSRWFGPLAALFAIGLSIVSTVGAMVFWSGAVMVALVLQIFGRLPRS